MISTVPDAPPARLMTSRTLIIAGLSPTIASMLPPGRMWRWSRSTWRTSCRRSAAARTRINNSSRKNGFCTKSTAPSFMDSTAVSTVPKPVMMMKEESTRWSRSRRSTSTPERPGIRMSDRITSNPPLPAIVSPSSPVAAV